MPHTRQKLHFKPPNTDDTLAAPVWAKSYLLSRSFSMYSNFGVSTPFEVMTAFRNKEVKKLTFNLTKSDIIFNHSHLKMVVIEGWGEHVSINKVMSRSTQNPSLWTRTLNHFYPSCSTEAAVSWNKCPLPQTLQEVSGFIPVNPTTTVFWICWLVPLVCSPWQRYCGI